VRLVLKLSGGVHKKATMNSWKEYQIHRHDERISFQGYHGATIAEMVAFYRSVDVYVGLAQFEGFGLPPLEAMAYGSTVIAHAWSGMVDFCYEPACFRVHSAFLRKDPQFHDDGVWAVADVYHAAHVMRQVHGLYRSGVLPAAGKHARACVTAAFDYGAIVEQRSRRSRPNLPAICFWVAITARPPRASV